MPVAVNQARQAGRHFVPNGTVGIGQRGGKETMPVLFPTGDGSADNWPRMFIREKANRYRSGEVIKPKTNDPIDGDSRLLALRWV